MEISKTTFVQSFNEAWKGYMKVFHNKNAEFLMKFRTILSQTRLKSFTLHESHRSLVSLCWLTDFLMAMLNIVVIQRKFILYLIWYFSGKPHWTKYKSNRHDWKSALSSPSARRLAPLDSGAELDAAAIPKVHDGKFKTETFSSSACC